MKIAIALLLLLTLPGCATVAAEPRWQRIFDGKSLDGWTPKVTGAASGENLGNSFSVADGAIRVTYAGWDRFNGRFGHLAYNRPLSAYRLRFEYRLFGRPLPDVQDWQHSNSGVMLHGQAPGSMRQDQQFPVSLEVQFLGAERPERAPTGNLCTPGTHVVIDRKLVTEHCTNSTGPVIPNGRWVQAEVEVTRDGEVTHFIDGQPVFRFTDPQYDPTDADAKPLIAAAGGKLQVRGGFIYLQSEGHPVEFRNIELMELE